MQAVAQTSHIYTHFNVPHQSGTPRWAVGRAGRAVVCDQAAQAVFAHLRSQRVFTAPVVFNAQDNLDLPPHTDAIV